MLHLILLLTCSLIDHVENPNITFIAQFAVHFSTTIFNKIHILATPIGNASRFLSKITQIIPPVTVPWQNKGAIKRLCSIWNIY